MDFMIIYLLNYKNGIASPLEWEDQKASIALILGWPFGRLWWREAKIYYPEEFVSEIDDALSNTSDSNTLVDQLKALSEGAKQMGRGT